MRKNKLLSIKVCGLKKILYNIFYLPKFYHYPKKDQIHYEPNYIYVQKNFKRNQYLIAILYIFFDKEIIVFLKKEKYLYIQYFN